MGIQVTDGTGLTTVGFNKFDTTLDSFERLRVSEPSIAFEHTFGSGLPTDIWESTAVGAGTATNNPNNAEVVLATTTTTATGYWIQTYQHIRYAPGISTMVRYTFNFTSLIAGVRSRVGMFTDQGTFPSTSGDGVFLEANGTGVNIVLRSFIGGSGTETSVAQASWSLDPLNGTGESGVNLDWTKPQHLVIEYQWLGVGTVRFGFETGPKGVIWAHELQAVNLFTTAYTRTGTIPVRAETYATGTPASAGNLKLINVSVLQEGNVLSGTRQWRHRSANSGATAKTGGTALGVYPLLGVRAATTNDITKRAAMVPAGASIVVTTAATGATALQWALVIPSADVAGATFSATAGNAQVDQAATATTAVTVGTVMASGIIPNATGLYTMDFSKLIENGIRIGQNAAGTLAATNNSMFLTLGPVSGTVTVAATAIASLDWKEIV